jgi:hypothetical protein
VLNLDKLDINSPTFSLIWGQCRASGSEMHYNNNNNNNLSSKCHGKAELESEAEALLKLK